MRASGPETLVASSSWNSAPSPAMPVAMPIWRNVELMPEPMPARAGGTTPTAVDASGGFTRPTPMPAKMKPGSSTVHAESASTRAISTSPRPTSPSPPPIIRRTGNPRRQLARDRRHEERQQRDRQEAQPGLQRRVAERVLDVQRHVEEHREQRRRQRERRDRGARERGLAQKRQVEHRPGLAALDDDERAQQDDRADEERDDQRATPALGVAAHERED